MNGERSTSALHQACKTTERTTVHHFFGIQCHCSSADGRAVACVQPILEQSFHFVGCDLHCYLRAMMAIIPNPRSSPMALRADVRLPRYSRTRPRAEILLSLVYA